MAIPPDPIEEVIPACGAAVLAEVLSVLEPQKPRRGAPAATGPQPTSAPTLAPRQLVKLRISEVLFGDGFSPGSECVVEKPPGAYSLRVGVVGPFLLGPGLPAEVLGRYGPDTYPIDELKRAAHRAGLR